MNPITLVGRSSSHFTRVTRMFANELGVPHVFRPVFDLATLDAAVYGDNPALKIPVLVDERGPLFGAENVCRELVRRSGRASEVVMRGDVADRIVANSEELTLHAMTMDVTLTVAKMMGNPALAPPKAAPSMEKSLDYLDANVDHVLAALPPARAFAFVEVALFCLVTHLPFREVRDVGAIDVRWTRLGAFCDRFGERESARKTAYCFDAK